MVHCSGGAQTKILHFLSRGQVIKDNLFPTPPLFELIQKESQTPWKEMYQVFNMGHRMEFYLDPKHAQEIIDIAAEFNIESQIVGRVLDADQKSLTIVSEHGHFDYH
jgi:phosphoribosylformylglycinamidine cyclo-ligase